ncbi:MAG TPA: AraC family transcriptional regulator [Gemmatimonadaceae bacterium]|nr:AraC family transcriptional regulator [Gemmatimonadaceae bacterium]
MSIAVFLQPHQLAHVRHVFVTEDEFFVADSWKRLEAIIRVEPVTVVIIDPAADGTMRIDAVASLLSRFPSLSFVGYVSLNAESFGAIAQLSRRGLQHVVLHRFDDSRERLQQTISRVRANPPSQRMLALLAPALKEVPLTLARAVRDMFERPHRYGSVLDLATATDLPPVSVYRYLESAGIMTPKKLLMVAKLTRALTYLRDPGYSVREVAAKLGYKHARILTSHAIEVFQVTPSRVRSRLSDDDAIAMLIRFIDLPDSAVKPRKRWAQPL